MLLSFRMSPFSIG
ncbi:hypothetical protein LINPERPRIM_LOCUS28851 [Linum perenne]